MLKKKKTYAGGLKMKKYFVTLSLVITVLLSALLVLSGCGDKGPSGKAEGEADLLALLPQNAVGIFFVNFKKFAGMGIFDKIIKDSEEKKADRAGEVFESYQDFIDKTGINPKKDISSLAFAIFGKLGPMAGEPDMVGVIYLNFNKDTILGLLKEKGVQFGEETYNGIAIYRTKDQKGKEVAFSFINEKIMAGGTPDLVKQVIDISKGAAQNILADAGMKTHLEQLQSGAVFSFIIEIPEEAKKMSGNGMFKMDLSNAEVIRGHMDHSGSGWNGEVVLVSHNEEANKQIASTLNGFKMFGAAGGPEFAELVGNIKITGTEDSVKITITVSDELLEKLKAKAEEKAKGLTTGQSPF